MNNAVAERERYCVSYMSIVESPRKNLKRRHQRRDVMHSIDGLQQDDFSGSPFLFHLYHPASEGVLPLHMEARSM